MYITVETMSIEKLHALGKSLSSPFYPSKNITMLSNTKVQKLKVGVEILFLKVYDKIPDRRNRKRIRS